MQADSTSKYYLTNQPSASAIDPFEIEMKPTTSLSSSENNSNTKSDTPENMDCCDCCGKICSECTQCCGVTCGPLFDAYCTLCICLTCCNQ
ncbi:unnamed protein product [Adineta ricciae]|uniref:Uncharacterized protein n=1 Tax=Adineta ricciae TaxID=249248 RepID=A0A814SII9_ADIRI|nr:unnamed protein product [Adineta ricciae]CAF1148540.1 unnamed protein product [Adineta ricciae]